MKKQIHKVAIIGGGVAGLTAAVYALRANSEVLLFEQYGLGGLTATLDKIENFPSYKSIEGWQLAQNSAEQAEALGLKVVNSKVVSLTLDGGRFVIKTESETYNFLSVIIAAGTLHNKLGIEGDYVGKGVSYCATCDGNFFRKKTVAVAGGGNAAVKEALYLAEIASKLYVVNPEESFKADAVSLDKLRSYQNVEFLIGTTVTGVSGDGKLEQIKLYDGHSLELDVSALFVAIGAAPSLDFLKIPEVERKNGYLKVDGRRMTNIEGLYAAGDVTDGSLKQIVTACADGALAGSFAAAFAAASARKVK